MLREYVSEASDNCDTIEQWVMRSQSPSEIIAAAFPREFGSVTGYDVT